MISDIESKGAEIKSKCVKIANSFRASRPDHEFTSLFNEIEQHIYQQHELLIKTIAENERLKMQMSQMNNDVDIEFEDVADKVIESDVPSEMVLNKRLFNNLADDDLSF